MSSNILKEDLYDYGPKQVGFGSVQFSESKSYNYMHLVFQNLHLTAVGNFLKFRIQIQIDRQTRINYLIKFAQNSHQKSRNCTCLPPARQPVRTCPSHAKSTQISCPPLPQPPPRIECPLNQSSISQTLRKRENSLSLSLFRVFSLLI